MWPLKLDMSKDESRGALRRLELEAYSSVVSTFRAQGSLDSVKQNVLDQLKRCFHISEDRHKAEVRRVANSEKLATISELLNGKSYDLEWIREGHRNYPLIGRAPPYSALHILADHASKAAAIENSDLPDPSDTRRTNRPFDEELSSSLPIVTEDPTLPPPSPATFGISRKDLKKSFDLSALQQSARKKHYKHLKPPPPPNVKIQHLYQTLNAKRPRKSLTKKSSKSRSTKQSPGRFHLPYPPPDHFDGAELQRHLTSQLMPPPMSPMKSTSYAPILPAGKKDLNLIKMNHQQLEPQAHYIPTNPARLKSELMSETTKGRAGRNKNINTQHRNSHQQQKYANGAGARNLDHIPDPQIIFNTTSSAKLEQAMDSLQREHNNHEMDMSPQAMASPLQLLSTAASCTPKLKINSPVHPQQPSTSQSTSPLPSQKTLQNRAIKIIPANTKPMIIKTSEAMKNAPTIVTAPSSKFKIQKIQLVMNKSQDGSSTSAGLSPSATIVSGKAGQLVLSGKGITNSYQVGGKPPYTIVSAPKHAGPKVIVQTIDRNFVKESNEIPENQRITENTPIDFMPSTTGTTNFPKVIIQKSATTAPKQIKFKFGPSLVNPKIVKGPIPANVKIQRNINMKGFTVLNSSQIVQLQAQAATVQAVLPTSSSEGTKVDWEQELDDANRTSTGKSTTGRSNGEGSVAKKIRLDESAVESLQDASLTENETALDISEPTTEIQSPIENVQEPEQLKNASDVVSEYVFLNNEEEVDSNTVQETAITNGEVESVEVNGEVDDERQPQNGAEAYENLVKSLTECEPDYMKEIDEPQMDENFGLTMIDENFTFTRESGLFQ